MCANVNFLDDSKHDHKLPKTRSLSDAHIGTLLLKMFSPVSVELDEMPASQQLPAVVLM